VVGAMNRGRTVSGLGNELPPRVRVAVGAEGANGSWQPWLLLPSQGAVFLPGLSC